MPPIDWKEKSVETVSDNVPQIAPAGQTNAVVKVKGPAQELVTPPQSACT